MQIETNAYFNAIIEEITHIHEKSFGLNPYIYTYMVFALLYQLNYRNNILITLLFLILQNFELKQLKKGGTWTESVNTKEINWFPLQKVNFARRKLEGVNPSVITR